VPEEDLLVGEGHPLVNGSSLLLVGRKDGLVGTELGNCISVSMLFSFEKSLNGWNDQILRYHSRFPRHSVIKTGITEVVTIIIEFLFSFFHASFFSFLPILLKI
jgi:hypothetical protein